VVGRDPSSEVATTDAATTDVLATEAPPHMASTGSRVAGWARIIRGNRTIWIVAGIAVASLVLGVVLGRFVVSPSDAAAESEPPEPGLITVPVEFGVLSNDVTLRADVGFADPVEVEIDTADLGGPAVVTGQVPEVGATLAALSVALEIAGRPVIVLPGSLPAYRTLRLGVSGPDVLQLKQALVAVGIDPGNAGSNVFDAATSRAISSLYAAVGYPTPASPEGTTEAVRAAQDMVRSADESIAAARTALNDARSGPSPVAVREADNAIATAQGALDVAELRLQAEEDRVPVDPIALAEAQNAVTDATNTLELAELQRAQLFLPRGTSAEQSALDSAIAQRALAVETLGDAREGAMTYLPAGEVLYLSELPRRVDVVAVRRGAVLEGAAMTVSGATIQLSASASEADARLLEVGASAIFDLPDGGEHEAVIASIEEGDSSSARWSILLTPDELTAEQVSSLQNENVRLRISVGSTAGEVLSVPLAALTAGPGGEARVEVVTGDPRDGDDADTRLVVVETGLAAAGYVEVRVVEGELDAGDLVVVGR
jgi:peptidoglycan hydrolase-like protein with peptidoglycan-binding domain